MKTIYRSFFSLWAIVLLSFIIHSSYIFNGFSWLDHNDIQSKQAIVDISQMWRIFFIPFGRTGFYRPIVTLINSFDFIIYKNNSFGYHATNVLLHGVVVYASYFFCKTFFNLKKSSSLVTSLIVAVHPSTILVVGSITQRQELLLGMFTLFSLSFYAKFREKQSFLFFVFTITFFALAIFSKETALIIIPASMVLKELAFFFKKEHLSFRRISGIIFSIVLILIIYLILRVKAVPGTWGTSSVALSPYQWINIRLFLFSKILLELIIPLKPTFNDAVPIYFFINGYSFLAITILIIGSIVIFKKKKSTLSLILMMIILFILPGLSIIPVPRIGSPHYSYLPLIPFAALISLLIAQYPSMISSIIFSIWIIISSYSTFQTGFQFKNDYTLFSTELKNHPTFLEAHQYLGDYYAAEYNLQKASFHYGKSLEKHPFFLAYIDHTAVLNNYATVLAEQNKLEDAEILIEKIKNPGLTTLYNHALIAYKLGDHIHVTKLLQKYIIQYHQAEPILLLASSYHILGKEEPEYATLKMALPYISKEKQNLLKKYMKSLQESK